MNIDDPKLTAYALGELDEAERTAIAHEVAGSPEAQREVQETQTIARLLRKEFATELSREAPLRANLSDIRDDPWFWTRARPLAIAAVLALFAVIGLVIFGSYKLRQHAIAQANRSTLPSPPVSLAVEAEGEESRNPTDSYTIVQRLINNGAWPLKDTVRIEEMINYFTYDYPQPKAKELFSINVDVASCPWESSHRLVRIGLKGREIAATDKTSVVEMSAIAKNARIQVAFNSARVASHHLIGSKDVNNNEIDLEEIGAGQSMTVLYEIVPVGANANRAGDVPPVDPLKDETYPTNTTHGSNSAEMLTVRLRYKRPDGDKSELIECAVIDGGKQFANASPDFKFAAAVAEFGMLLRDSQLKENGTFRAVLAWAQEGKGIDRNGYRAGFLELVRKAEALKRG
jgi:Domain of unknown function (DUF3520)/von Willebrand factor